MKKRINATVAEHSADFLHKLGDGNTSYGIDIVLDALTDVFQLIELTNDELAHVYKYVIKQRGAVSIMLYDSSMPDDLRVKLRAMNFCLIEIAVLKSIAVHG